MVLGHRGALGLNVLPVAMYLQQGRETAQSLCMEDSTAIGIGQKQPCVKSHFAQVDSM